MPYKTHMIGYDLDQPGQNYTSLHEAIKSLSGGRWWHNLDSTWFIQSTQAAGAIRDKLKQHIDQDDKLLVMEVTGMDWASAGLKPSGNDWLKNHV